MPVLGASGAATMLQFEVAVVVLLALIMLLLVVTLGFTLSSPGRISCSKGNRKRETPIYESIEEEEEDERHNRVTQILKIRVTSGDGAAVQQDMLLRVQVEAIPLLSDAEKGTPSSPTSLSPKNPPLSPKPLLLRLQQAPETPTLQHLGELKPIIPPKKPSYKMPVSPAMIKDPALFHSQSETSLTEHVALLHRASSSEYLQPNVIRKDKTGLKRK